MANEIRQELLNIAQVRRMMGMSKSRFNDYLKEEPRFPKPFPLSPTAVEKKKRTIVKRWLRADVESFIQYLKFNGQQYNQAEKPRSERKSETQTEPN